jgi:hypothetical protein
MHMINLDRTELKSETQGSTSVRSWWFTSIKFEVY